MASKLQIEWPKPSEPEALSLAPSTFYKGICPPYTKEKPEEKELDMRAEEYRRGT